jgi:hypothetical protein
MRTMTPEQKAKLVGTLVRYGIYALMGFIALPYVILAIKGWLLLIALVALIGGTLTLAPAISMAAQNWRLKMIKEAAKRNPIETMQNVYREKCEALSEGEKRLVVLRTKRTNYMGKLASFKRKFPDDAAYFDEAATRLTQILRHQEKTWVEAREAVTAYAGEVEKTQAIWEMGKAAAEATEGAEFTEEDFLSKIKSDTAIDAAREQLDMAFSQLDQTLLESNEAEPTGRPLPEPARTAFQKALET